MASASRVVLISPYELGRQPFALAQPAAWLADAGFTVDCLDLSLQKLNAEVLSGADLIAVYLGMHTATRIAMVALPKIRDAAPHAHLCAYGLYAPMNENRLRESGINSVYGGECEPQLLALAQALAQQERPRQTQAEVPLAKIDFRVPRRAGLPDLQRYAHLRTADGTSRVVAFAEGSRGCKHLCRHCPVVPVYHGRFRIVPMEIVAADIEQQVAAGAQHVSFGDPDFFNGPTHARRLLRMLRERFPGLTFDATIKVEHLLAHAELLQELKDSGCLFVTTAVESVDDAVLEHLQKGHTRADFREAVRLARAVGLDLAPTFVPFTPWTSLDGYRQLLEELVELELVESVPPVQLSIRLLIPQGSYLLRIPGFAQQLEAFDGKSLGYPWVHADVRVDALQKAVQACAEEGEKEGWSRRDIFARIWALVHEASGLAVPDLPSGSMGQPIAHMSEPWYCCAEPTDEQLQGF